MPDHYLSWLADVFPAETGLAESFRRALDRLFHPVATPAVALVAGACLPGLAHGAMAILPAVAAGLIFCAVTTAAPGRTSVAEALRAAAILHVCMLACPVAVALAMSGSGFGPALTCAATMVAGSPVALGGGVVAERIGLPGRPVVWAAVMGVAFVPFNLPLVAAATGAPGLPTPGALTTAALAIAGLPLALALAARRLAPGAIGTFRTPLRLGLVFCLAVLGCSAGGRAVAALARPDGWTGCAVALGVQAAAAWVAWGLGRAAEAMRRSTSPTLAPQLALASAMRNVSIVWAACLAAGGMTPLTEAVVSTFLATTVLAPPVATALRWRVSSDATTPRRPR